jgi:N-methylhydantoinase B/oxoprolinase/acetone carboxylase alpha subunit
MSGRDSEIQKRIKPEPPTPLEEKCMEKIESIDLAIFSHKMHMISIECKENLVKTGGSTGCRWGDVGFSIFTTSGDLAMAATGIWFHTVLGQIPLKYIIKHWANDPSVGIKEGDAFFCNDPYYLGVHGADMIVYTPAFYKGELVCWVGAVIHTGENGSCEPGGAPLSSRSRYDEGLLVPPIKISENNVIREDILNMFSHMVRDPRTLILDIKARISTCRLGERRISDVIEKKGKEFFIGALRKLILTTGEAAKTKLRKLNDGVYRQPRWVDTIGIKDALLKVMVTFEKRGDHLYLDLTDTSPEVPDRGINTFWMGIVGLCSVYLCGYLFWDLPANGGLLETLDWNIPERTIVNPNPEAPTGTSPFVQVSFEHALSINGAKMLYDFDKDRACACWFRGFNMPYFGGLNQWGEPIADMGAEINAGGHGGRRDMDGVDVAGAFFATLSDCGEVEEIEIERPFLYPYRRFFKNNLGHGKFRGGAGMDYAIMVKNVPWLFLGLMGFGSKIPSTQGLFGGYAIPTIPFIKVRNNNLLQMMKESDSSIPYSTVSLLEERSVKGVYQFSSIPSVIDMFGEGDIIACSSGGGGGYGDVLERDPELVIKDLRDGIISHSIAKNVYKVVYDPKTLILDKEKTEELRQRERAERKTRGVPYHEFEKEWLKKKPKDEVLQFFGPWPYPSKKEG